MSRGKGFLNLNRFKSGRAIKRGKVPPSALLSHQKQRRGRKQAKSDHPSS